MNIKLITRNELKSSKQVKPNTEYWLKSVNNWGTMKDKDVSVVVFSPKHKEGIWGMASDFLNSLEMFERVYLKAKKIVVTIPRAGQTLDLYLTERGFLFHAHTKGNSWNICGNHYYYLHDYEGNFLYAPTTYNEPKYLKQRILKTQSIKLNDKYRKANNG